MDEQSPQLEPTTTIRPSPSIERNMRRIILWGMLVAIVVVIGSTFWSLIPSTSTAQRQQAGLQKPVAVSGSDLGAFRDQQNTEAKQLAATQSATDATDTQIAKNLNDIAYQQAHPDAKEANGFSMTPEQRSAMSGTQTRNTSGDSATYRGSSAASQKPVHIILPNPFAVDVSAAKNAASQVSPASPPQPAAVETTEAESTGTEESKAKPVTYDFNSASGPTYRLFEGTIIETVLTNRIAGALVGPIIAMVTTDVYSHDHQRVLIPQGSRIIGSVSAVNSQQQQRLFVAFHRIIAPDGYSISLDKFQGLDVVGESGLRDLVNRHYLSIFGASLAVGAIGGIAQIGNGYSTLGYDPSVALRNGISQELGQESTQILNKFLNQLPTFTVRERSRIKIYIAGDLVLPAYDAHHMPPTL